jgi:hypothetical protein
MRNNNTCSARQDHDLQADCLDSWDWPVYMKMLRYRKALEDVHE